MSKIKYIFCISTLKQASATFCKLTLDIQPQPLFRCSLIIIIITIIIIIIIIIGIIISYIWLLSISLLLLSIVLSSLLLRRSCGGGRTRLHELAERVVWQLIYYVFNICIYIMCYMYICIIYIYIYIYIERERDTYIIS